MKEKILILTTYNQPMKLNIKIEIEMFHATLYVMAGSGEEILKNFRKLKCDTLTDEGREKVSSMIEEKYVKKKKHAGTYIKLGCSQVGLIVISLEGKMIEENYIDTICEVVPHEVRHFIDELCEKIGVKDRETTAYMSGYITKKIIPALLKEHLK